MILPIRLSNASDSSTEVSTVATVDTTVPYLCLPAAMAEELGLQKVDTRPVRDADGKVVPCAYVGPVLVEARGAKAHMGAVTCGSELVLGRAALAALGLVADERHGKVYTDGEAVRLPSIKIA